MVTFFSSGFGRCVPITQDFGKVAGPNHFVPYNKDKSFIIAFQWLLFSFVIKHDRGDCSNL